MEKALSSHGSFPRAPPLTWWQPLRTAWLVLVWASAAAAVCNDTNISTRNCGNTTRGTHNGSNTTRSTQKGSNSTARAERHLTRPIFSIPRRSEGVVVSSTGAIDDLDSGDAREELNDDTKGVVISSIGAVGDVDHTDAQESLKNARKVTAANGVVLTARKSVMREGRLARDGAAGGYATVMAPSNTGTEEKDKYHKKLSMLILGASILFVGGYALRIYLSSSRGLAGLPAGISAPGRLNSSCPQLASSASRQRSCYNAAKGSSVGGGTAGGAGAKNLTAAAAADTESSKYRRENLMASNATDQRTDSESD
mmetsp:Transcript_78567/g.218141  ORF Transcript_78567/g.218141 Transcript_78567/m.218141 type:complete len:311 (+) Transcript_78567:97-1029(+)